MRAGLRAALAVYAKDVLIEARTRETLGATLAFAFVAAFIFTFAFEPSPRTLAAVGPGIVWTAYVFTAALGMNRTFLLEREQGTLDGLRLAPAPPEAVYFGKFFGLLTLLIVVEALLAPAFLALHGLSLLNVWFAAVAVAATVGIAAVGTLLSAIAAHARAREMMLPLLFVPLSLPLLIGAVSGTAAALDGEGWSGAGRWLQLIAAFDAVLIVVSSWAFEFALEE